MPIHGKLIPHSRQGHPFAFLDHIRRALPGQSDLRERRPPCVIPRRRPAAVLRGPVQHRILVVGGHAIPEASHGAFDLVDEVWVGTRLRCGRTAAS